MSFVQLFWHSVSFAATLWQTIKNLYSFSTRIFKAEQISEKQKNDYHPLTLDEHLKPLDMLREYTKAALNVTAAFAYSQAAIETITETCETAQDVPRPFCRYLYPIITAVAVGQTVSQAASYLSFKCKPD